MTIMTTTSNSSHAAGSNRRGAALGVLAGLVVASLGLGIAVPAQAQSSIAGLWTINGNGYTGGLTLHQSPGGELGGTIYGNDLFGFYSAGSRIAVLLRGPQSAPTQAFVGDVSPGGTEWAGTFYALNTAMGGAPERNAFGFRAVLGAPPYVHYSSPALGPAAADCLAPNFTVNNRPSEFPSWTFGLRFTNPAPPLGCISGNFEGTLAGDRIFGHYAHGSGSIVFLRMNGGLPAQVYVGRVSGGYASGAFNPQRVVGSFYALTTGMGASATRMRYDWSAVQQ